MPSLIFDLILISSDPSSLIHIIHHHHHHPRRTSVGRRFVILETTDSRQYLTLEMVCTKNNHSTIHTMVCSSKIHMSEVLKFKLRKSLSPFSLRSRRIPYNMRSFPGPLMGYNRLEIVRDTHVLSCLSFERARTSCHSFFLPTNIRRPQRSTTDGRRPTTMTK